MESSEINSTTVGGFEKASILFNDVEYDRKFRALQMYLPFVDNLLLQSSGKIASDRLQSLQAMLKETNTKMKYDVMAKCESVLQSLMKKMEAAKNAKSNDSTLRASTVQTSVATQPVQPGTTASTVTTNVRMETVLPINDQNEHQAKVIHSQVSEAILISQTYESSDQTLNKEQTVDEQSQLDANPENRSMVLTLKLAAARTARNAETTHKVSKRIPITWDDTSTTASKKSDVDTLKLAAARAARFAEPPQLPDPRRVTPKKDDPTETKESTAYLLKCSDISTLKLAAARNTKPTDIPNTVSQVQTSIPELERPDSFQMSRDKLKKFITPVQKVSGGEDNKSPPCFRGTRFDLDSPRNDWDFQAAPELTGHWNPSPPIRNAAGYVADAEGDSESNSTVQLKSPKSLESDLIASRTSDDSKTPAGSILGSSPLGSYYSPIHGLIQRRISSGHDSPLSPDESGPNTAEAKRRLRDKLSQEINMVHRVGTSKGGSLRGLATKDGKVPPISSKETSLGQDKKAGNELVKRPEKIVEIDMFSKELTGSSKNTLSEPTKECPKVLKGLYAPRYKSLHVNSPAKSGIVSSEHKPTSRSSIDANRLMKSPPSDPVSKKMPARTENKDATPVKKLPSASDPDDAGTHSRILSTMTTEELKRAVHLNVRNLPSPPTISALVLESVKAVVNRQPEKVILNPAFNNSPPQIEPGFFSKSDVDLRLGDSNGFYPIPPDVGFQQRSAPQAVIIRDPRTTCASRFDRDTPMSPDESSNHQLGQDVGPGPRHITYHLGNADGWQSSNSNSRWPQSDTVGHLPLKPPTEERFQSQHQSREAQWMNGGHQQMPHHQGSNVNHSSLGDFQGTHFEERHFQQPLGDQHAMQITRDQERNRRSSGDNRDFRGPQFHSRNAYQLPQERGRNTNHFPTSDGNNFQGPQFHSGSDLPTLDDRHLLQDPARNMNSLQVDDDHGFRGPQFAGRNVHHPMVDQRGVLPHDQSRIINPLPDNRNMLGANYQGRNVYGPSFDGHEQQMPRTQGGNVNHQLFSRNHDYPGMHNQGLQSHLQIKDCRNQNLTPVHMAAPLHPAEPDVQGANRDPRNLRDPPRPEINRHDKFQWRNPLLPTHAAVPSPRPARDLVPQTLVPPKPISLTNPSPTTVLENGRPANGPLSPLTSTTPYVAQILPNPDCIPFKPPRILDPRMANRTAPPNKGVCESVPSKDMSMNSQHHFQPSGGSNKQRKQRNSWTESSQKRYSKDHHSRRGSWEAEEARRREERRKSAEQSRSHRKHHDRDDNSAEKLSNKSDIVSPLNSLYGSTIIQKTGVGYGIQKFKIPKIKRPSPPRPVEPAIAPSVESPGSAAAESLVEPEPAMNLPPEELPLAQKAEEKLEPSLKPLEQNPAEQQTIEQNPVEPLPEKQPATEQPIVEKPHVKPMPLAAPIVEAFMQQGNVNVNQLLENLKLLGNLKPNQLKKFKNILMNSSSSDDSDVDDSAVAKKKKDSKFKKSKKKCDGGLNKSSEDTESKDSDALCIADTNSPAKSDPETEQVKPNVCKKQESVVPTRKLRGRKPGPLSAKKKALESSSEAVAHSNDLDSSNDSAPKTRITRSKRRNSLEILQADVKEMYISEGVLSASGRRICTILKKDETLTAVAKELPKKSAESLADDDSDNQNTASKKKTPPKSSKKVTVLSRMEKSTVPASRRSGRSLKQVDRSASSSEGEDALDEIVSESAIENASESDDEKAESIKDKDVTAEMVDSDSVYIKPRPRKRKPVKRRSNLKDLSTTATSSASEDDEETIPSKAQRKKILKKTNKSREAISRVACVSMDSTSKVLTNADYNSSSIRKKRVTKPKILDTSDSCIESVYSSVRTSTSTDDVDFSAEHPQTLASNISTPSNITATKPSVNLAAYVKLQKMTATSLTPSPSFCSSDESSDIVPLTALAGPMTRQVARRGGRGRAPSSRRSQPVSGREARVSSEFDGSMPSDGFPKAATSGRTGDAYLGESISDIIDRLSKDDDEAKGGEGDSIADEDAAATKESVPAAKNQKKKRKSNWSLGVIKKKRPIKSSSPESVGPETTTKKIETEDDVEIASVNKIVSVEEQLVQTREADLTLKIAKTNQKEGVEMAMCDEEISESKKTNPLPPSDQTVASADAADNERLNEEQDSQTPCVIPKENCSTKSERNVDKSYFIHHNFKSRKYPCKLCSWSGTAIVAHYTLTHPNDEPFIARLSEEAAVKSMAESKEKGYFSAEDTEVSSEKYTAKRKNQNFTCRICFFKCTNFVQFYDHCCGHTGEYRYKCSQCEALVGGKGNLNAHYHYHHKELRTIKDKYTEIFPLPPAKSDGAFGFICPLCNFVQMRKPNVVKHVQVHHPDKGDSVKIVCINMHVDSDKKRIALRKRSKSVDNAAPEMSCDAEASKESGNSTKPPVDDEDQSQTIDLAAFLPTDQENSSHPDIDLVIEDSTVSSFASKLMPDDQNTLIDALLKRTENISEGNIDYTPNQTNLLEHDGILNIQMPPGNLLADDVSQDSCLSDSTITDDVPFVEPAIGTSDLMDDIIKRLTQSTAQELSDDSDAIEPLARVKLEDQHPEIFVGPFEVRRAGNLPIYSCEVDNCNFSAVSAESFISHLKYNHLEETWDGMCQTCGDLVIIEDATKLLNAFLHLLKTHLSSLGVESKEAQHQVTLNEETPCQQDPLSLPDTESSSEQTPFIRLRTRRLSGDILSVQKNKVTDEDDENMCVIENVVSLAATTQSFVTDEIKLEPLLQPVIAEPVPKLAFLAENVDEPPSAPIRSPPKIMRFANGPPPSFKVPMTFPKTLQDPALKGQMIRKRKGRLSKVVDNIAKVQQQAMVQCFQAKEEKEPAAYEKMLERPKLRHLFKCMARSCSYSSNNSIDFGRHVAEHEVGESERCSYCMNAFVGYETGELVTHVQLEHGHCTYQCAYCFYRAVCPSYVVVHQNFIHTNKSISVLQCLGTAEVVRPTIPLADVVPSYVCGQSECGETFLLTEQFTQHLHEMHTQIHNYSCHLCDTVCFDSRNFIAHYRVHSLYLYQCRYCVHGTSNEEVMHHHLCNFHPGQKPLVVMREANGVGVDKPVDVDDLTIIDLGDLNPVADARVVRLPMNEMVEEVEDGRLMIVEPESSEGDVSGSDALMTDASDETAETGDPSAETVKVAETCDELVKTADQVSEEIAMEESGKAKDISVKPQTEAICVIDLDSDDDVKIVDLTSSPDERSLRALRSSPRKPPAEGEAVERRPRTDKRTSATKEEGTAKPRATTSFEFGAITLEDLNDTGLSGEMLFRCGFSECEWSCETVEDLREHLMVCDHSRNSHGLMCPHCQRPMKNLAAFCDHLRLHSTCRYGCGLCVFRATAAKPVQAHLRSRHRIAVTRCIALNPLKADPENDLFVVGPLRPDKRKNHLVSQLQSPDKKSRPKYVYQPDEGHLLPIGAIYPFIVTCATCSFTTKVRKNMERHLVLHKSDFSVPSQNPVNAVPCLETKEMMFDKMTNLAASSNLKAPDATNLYLTPEDIARLPKFVPEQQRYRCGTKNCTYNSCDENMLIHHLRALHRDEDYYNCPHCLPLSETDPDGEQVSLILIDKLSLHLKMHDNRLYKCGYCFYFDHRRHIVERHVTDKHSDYKMHLNVVREPFGDGSTVDSAKAPEKEAPKEMAPRFAWKCSRCEFESATRSEMVNHSDAEHGKKLQYECGLCHNRFQSKQSFDQHCGFKHPGLKEQLLFNFFKVENAVAQAVEPAFDTRPLWRRDGASVKHIRGILFDDGSVKPPSDVPEPEPPAPPEETPPVKEAMFLCSICKVFETAVKADMKIHLYKELKYFRYQCTVCDKKVFSLMAGKKHMSRAHASTDASAALTLFERDLETEQKVEEILAAQEDLMQLDPSMPVWPPPRPPKPKAARTKDVPAALGREPEAPGNRGMEVAMAGAIAEMRARVPEAEPTEASSNVHESDASITLDDSDEERPQPQSTTRRKARPPKTLECKECGQLFRSVRGLKAHIRLSHLMRGKWKCNTCNATHTNRNFIESHAKSAHPNAATNPPFGTNPAWSASPALLSERYWRETWDITAKAAAHDDGSDSVTEPEEAIECRHCATRFTSAAQRNRHETWLCERKPLWCGHCGFDGDEPDVRRHSELAHPSLPVSIEAASDRPDRREDRPDVASAPDGRRRKQKLKSRTSFDESPPAKQPRCDRTDDRSPPARHFGCFYCPMRSKKRALVQAHWLHKHKEPQYMDNGDVHANTGVVFKVKGIDGPLGAFPCAECGSTFDAEPALGAHVASTHPVGDVRCPKCDFETRNLDEMRTHLHRHTFDVKCTLCAESFVGRKNAEYHWELEHPDDPFEADSFVLDLDMYPTLRPLARTSAQVGMVKNVARKSTTKVPRAGEFYARKSTGNAPWKRGSLVSPRKGALASLDISQVSVSVLIGQANVDMRVDTYAEFFDIYPRVLLVDFKHDPTLNKYIPS